MAIPRKVASAATACAAAVGLMLASTTPASANVASGDYRIAFEGNGAEMVPYGGATVRTDVRVWPADHVGMEWDVAYSGHRSGMASYEIRNLRSGLCMQPKDGSTTVNQRVEQTTCSDRNEQRWHVSDVGNGAHQIIPVKNTQLGVTLENPDWNGSFLKLGYHNPYNPDYRWHFNRV
ncbi:RICIN domain-containing protein [Nocardiopsis salina]|uniref:RICIN domain-containing protein n=1 Tax=Nocardiopsis salina TaxID=245836 RepID=UPI0012687983|nr:RICIN domain-containing protein [Nocardiopsis salina]